MKLLLDTHVLIWAATNSGELSSRARQLLAQDDHTFFVSAVSAWEIATKHRLGKLPAVSDLIANYETRTREAGYLLLPITWQHGLAAGSYPQPHKDPFDRLLVAQAMIEKMTLLSSDDALDGFGIKRVW